MQRERGQNSVIGQREGPMRRTRITIVGSSGAGRYGGNEEGESERERRIE